MATFICTLLLVILLVGESETRQSKEEGLWVVRQVVPLPAEEVVIYIDPEEGVEEKKEGEDVVFLANTSRKETKTATLPIVMGVIGGVMFAFASLLAVLYLRPIRLSKLTTVGKLSYWLKLENVCLTLLPIRRHSREDCLAKVRESQMEEEGREWEILEDEQIVEEAEREWGREVEKEALYISPEISV